MEANINSLGRGAKRTEREKFYDTTVGKMHDRISFKTHLSHSKRKRGGSSKNALNDR